MSTKENAAVSQLLALLEARYALRVLWALRDGHAQTFRLLQDSVGGITPNTLNTRIKELREAGIVGHGSDGYSLTLSGQDLLKRLSDLQAFAGKWQLGQIKKAAAPVAPAASAPAPTPATGAPVPAAQTPAAAPVPTPARPDDDTSHG
ncbi:MULTISPECIES: winged helix-turn-helix transcriptional regulator [Variovorax]|uniref:winged helix-turn-helix transcriptional regulator n=1 Tax=Variovorax TaxID=34072 RepID=UPI000869D72A|nr:MULTISPECIES: winged helix-turn-helix transcriptional regulator [Variovorax]MBN8753557.1 helix-turn-helix transcriptional regulator [Variovorax sp.]ODU13006.1 MAG: transcriptional regulator [Variovorax sp. SCN 67-85]ODV27719.1 MAG: transcriptional regulator [Variovorax sp. SCN 67-20]OJZ12229.1 MAG: transcriptional regulator [Variovorax sp. 67-131]UKI05981.1 winged helix-turn-helix transcriptional regulator [Variovorax paradoxus]